LEQTVKDVFDMFSEMNSRLNDVEDTLGKAGLLG